MDYEWIYERMRPYSSADNGRPGTGPAVLVKMVLIQHLFGILSLRQTYRELQVNGAYRWFPGYNLLEEIPHFATVSYAFCNRVPPELSEEIFAHILNKVLNHQAGNANGSTAWDAVYGQETGRFPEAAFIVMDAGCKTPWIAKKPLEDNCIPILPYTRCKGRKDRFRPWDFTYDRIQDCFVCPKGQALRHTTTGKDGKRMYRSTPKLCQCCPCRQLCGANGKGRRLLTTHIWQEHLDLAEQLRKTRRGKEMYSLRKEAIERVFTDAKEKHGMRYTCHRGLARASTWARFKFAAMNLKKLALWLGKFLDPSRFSLLSFRYSSDSLLLVCFVCF